MNSYKFFMILFGLLCLIWLSLSIGDVNRNLFSPPRDISGDGYAGMDTNFFLPYSPDLYITNKYYFVINKTNDKKYENQTNFWPEVEVENTGKVTITCRKTFSKEQVVTKSYVTYEDLPCDFSYVTNLVDQTVSIQKMLEVQPFKTEEELQQWIASNLKDCFHSNGVPEEVHQ